MDASDANKTPDSSAMDIVSMAFSNVSENSDLIEVVSAGQTATANETNDSAAAAVHDLQDVHDYENMEEGNQSVNTQHQISQVQGHPGHIEIPLPPNAIITVNEQGEQIIELAQPAQVVDDADPDNMPNRTLSMEQVEHIEQQIETVITPPDENQPGPAGDVVPMAVAGDGLDAISFQGSDVHDVGMVGDEACVVPVTISLTDVQNLQQVVGGVHVGPGGESAQVSSGDIAVTSSTQAGLTASATSLFGSLASIIDTSSVLTNANSMSYMSSNAALSANGVTFVSAAGIPIQAVPSVGNSTGAEAQPAGLGANPGVSTDNFSNHSSSSTNTNSVTSPAQFIHNGTNLQRVNFKNGNLVQQKKQLTHPSDTTTSVGVRPGISTDQVRNLPSVKKTDPSANIGSVRSVFSPMTLTIRTPPGAPAVNQALINSIVNNAEVQALLKRNPGQPITIVRVPEDSADRRHHLPGVVTAKVVTSSSRNPSTCGSSIVRRPPGRPRKEPITVDDSPSNVPVRRRGRQPGTQIRRKEEEDYVPPASWQPSKSRTRSGRISKPPGYRTENFKPSYTYSAERTSTPSSDAEGGSDVEAEFVSRVAVTNTGRIKSFKCGSCSKAYAGRGRLARHFQMEPTHGNIEDYDSLEGSLQKPEQSTSEDVRNPPDEMADSEVNDKAVGEETVSSQSLTKEPSEQSSKVIDLDNEEPVTDNAVRGPLAQRPSEPVWRGKRGRPPRRSNASKNDPDFKPGASASKPGASASKPGTKSRKETMQQALKFLNRDDYIDVCLPRLARHLSLWDFLITKAELLKEDTPQVLKVLQLFEELVSDIREMAVNCLEKVEDEDDDTGALFLDEDDDLARVLEFDKGWYKVSEPPAGAANLSFSVSSLLKRTSDAVTKGEPTDEYMTPVKIRKVQSEEKGTTSSPAPAQPSTQLKPMPKLGPLTDPTSITVHVHGSKVTTEHGSPALTALRTPLQENVPSESSTDPGMVSTSGTSNDQQTGQIQDSDRTLLDTPLVPNQPSNSLTHVDPQQQQSLAPRAQEQQYLNPLDSEKTPPAATQEPRQEIEQSSGTQSSVDGVAPHTEVTPSQGTTGVEPTEQVAKVWQGEGQPEASSAGTQFVQAAMELASMAGSATMNQADMKVDPPDPAPHQETSVVAPEGSTIMQMDPSDSAPQQEASMVVAEGNAIMEVDPPDPATQQETSVVVPEGSTIMQMQDGTFLVQRPDGTAMQIHTPEGMSIETVQELLSMEAGHG